MTDVIMPQMGESIAEGTVTKWMKNVGDRVQRDEPLFEISTDKVDAEIPAPATGVLKEIRVQPGATVPINTVVAGIAAEHNLDIREVPGTGIAGRVTKQDILGHIETRAAAPAAPTPPPAPSMASPAPAAPATPSSGARGEVVPMSPIRKKTAEHMVLSKRTSAHVATVFEIDM